MKVYVDCEHPEIGNNIYPTRKGDCAECKWCKAKMSGKDALFLVEQNQGG